MPAVYNVFRNPGEGKKGGKLHARLVNQETIRLEQLVEEISESTSFSSADVKGMLEAFRSRLQFHLKRGDNVELEGLGVFSVSLHCPPSTTEKEVAPDNVGFRRVNFRCSKELKYNLQLMKVIRSRGRSRLKVKPVVMRKQNILRYVEEKGVISCYMCRSINACTKYLALKDLRELIEEGKIVRLGRKENALYGKK